MRMESLSWLWRVFFNDLIQSIKMEESIKELKEMFGDSVKVIGSMDELKEAVKEVKDGRTKH